MSYLLRIQQYPVNTTYNNLSCLWCHWESQKQLTFWIFFVYRKGHYKMSRKNILGDYCTHISTCPVGIGLGRENENHLFIVFAEGKNSYSLGKKCEQPFCLVLRKYAEPMPDTCMCRRIKTPQAWVVLSGHFTWHQKQDTVHTTVNLMIDKKSWFYEELLELITLIPYKWNIANNVVTK